MEKKKFNINLDDSVFTKKRDPVKPLFRPSCQTGQKDSSSQPVPQTSGQPLSYAEFIVQRKDSVPQKEGLLRVGGEVGTVKQGQNPSVHNVPGAPSCSTRPEKPQDLSDGPAGLTGGAVGEQEQGQTTPEDQMKEEGQRLDGVCSVASKPVGSGNSIVVSPRQRGNPVLKFVRSVPWEFGEVVPDYVLGQTTCALFLSLRYHNLNPNYIHDRLKQLGHTFTLRVLLVQIDVKDPHHAVKELARICVMADCTLMLAWSPEEAGRYLETYKSYENKPADLLQEHVEKDYLSKVTDCLTTVKSVNKTDAMTLLSTFSSLEGIIKASKEDLVLCPGLGPQKARRLYDILHQPFLKSRKKDQAGAADP